MRILFAGTPSTAATALEGLLASGHEVVAVLTREDAPVGRKRVLTPSPVAELAVAKGLPVIKANRLGSEILAEIKALKVDLAIVVAYGVILRADALSLIPNGWFNLHFSHLPRWRGAAPVQRALIAGDKETGVTLFKIDEGLDTGDILGIADTVIGPEETADELLNRLSSIGVSLLNQELPRLYSGSYTLSRQEGEVALAPKIQRSEARIDFSSNAKDIENLVRGMNSEPMAWCSFAGEPMRILRARQIQVSHGLAQGQVAEVEGHIIVGAGQQSSLELQEVHPASKTVMSAKSWMNGQSGNVVLE
jgi:methionyl-tRNA formyltransferase